MKCLMQSVFLLFLVSHVLADSSSEFQYQLKKYYCHYSSSYFLLLPCSHALLFYVKARRPWLSLIITYHHHLPLRFLPISQSSTLIISHLVCHSSSLLSHTFLSSSFPCPISFLFTCAFLFMSLLPVFHYLALFGLHSLRLSNPLPVIIKPLSSSIILLYLNLVAIHHRIVSYLTSTLPLFHCNTMLSSD